MLTSIESSVIYSVATRKVNGMKCRSHLDTDYGNLYDSGAIIDLLKIKPIRK